VVGNDWITDMCCHTLGAGCLVWPIGMVEATEVGEDSCCCRGKLTVLIGTDGQLSTQLLLSHPPLLLLSPLLLAVFAFTSLPFLTMVVRLGMIGYWRHP
jgi:hypothetical protein